MTLHCSLTVDDPTTCHQNNVSSNLDNIHKMFVHVTFPTLFWSTLNEECLYSWSQIHRTVTCPLKTGRNLSSEDGDATCPRKMGTQPVLWRRGHNLSCEDGDATCPQKTGCNLSSEDGDATCPLETGTQPVLERLGHNLSCEDGDATCPQKTGMQPFLSCEDGDTTCPVKMGTQPVLWRWGHNLSSEDGDATFPQNVVHCISMHVMEKVQKVYEFKLYFLATWHISLQSYSSCAEPYTFELHAVCCYRAVPTVHSCIQCGDRGGTGLRHSFIQCGDRGGTVVKA